MMSTLPFAAVALLLVAGAGAAPTGKVQVYIMMGQSNMLGEGRIGTLTPPPVPEKEQAELLPQLEATETAPVGAGATCAPQSWWVNVSFTLGRHGAPTRGGKRTLAASEADCCGQCMSEKMDFWTYRKNFTGGDPQGTCWLMNTTAQNVTEAYFLSLKNGHLLVNYTSGGVNPLPPPPHFPLPKPPPPPPNNTLAQAVEAGKYPYLYDAANKSWTTSKTVRNVFTMGGGGPCGAPCANASTPRVNGSIETNSFMNGGDGHKGSVGPELGIGAILEQHSPTSRVMLLKSCIGNRALGWDLLPPTQTSFDWPDPTNSSLVWTYAGYHQSPARWEKGTTPVPISWRAGLQYDGDLKRADDVLADFGTYYPGATNDDYEIAGFFWWQVRVYASVHLHQSARPQHAIRSTALTYFAPPAPRARSLSLSLSQLSSLPLRCRAIATRAMPRCPLTTRRTSQR